MKKLIANKTTSGVKDIKISTMVKIDLTKNSIIQLKINAVI